MSFGNILGQLMQSGLGGGSPSRSRIDSATRALGSGNLGGILSEVQNALGRAGGGSAGQSAQGMAGKAGQWLKTEQAGGLSGAQLGGIGAVAGALLGGGSLSGAAKGGALAVLGTLAIGALRNAQARQQVPATGASDLAPPPRLPSPEEADTAVEPGMERLVLKAMIGAAKADGQIDQKELSRLFQHLDNDTATAEEKQFLLEELNRPADVETIAAEVRTPVQAAEIYAASLLAIHVDTEAERQYLARLATALGLDQATVVELHRMTGADA